MSTTVRVLIGGITPASPRARFASVELPDGWRRVFQGAVKPGDRFLDARQFAGTGQVEFVVVESVPDPPRPYSTADWYMLLIRPGQPETSPDQPCERCRSFARVEGERFCYGCRQGVIEDLRKVVR